PKLLDHNHGMPTVLIIDDNPSVATALDVLFSLHDIDTVAAETPEAGLAMLDGGGIDLVIQDMNFRADTTSGDEGVALFKQIRDAPEAGDQGAVGCTPVRRGPPEQPRSPAPGWTSRRAAPRARELRKVSCHGGSPCRPADRRRVRAVPVVSDRCPHRAVHRD